MPFGSLISIAPHLRRAFGGAPILAEGFRQESANRAVREGRADFIAFGALYIANPDLIKRFRRSAPLNAPDPSTFYVGGEKGYIDYPFLSASATPPDFGSVQLLKRRDMFIDWTHFTPLSSIVGGVLIGLAAAALVLGSGRILGAAGIVGGVVDPHEGDVAWRLWLILGLVLAPAVLSLVSTIKAPSIDASWPLIVVAGLVVGFGARLGSGCTSGHGVCGISRLSPRSIAATALFMASGIVTVFVTRHLVG